MTELALAVVIARMLPVTRWGCPLGRVHMDADGLQSLATVL
jgi:hypothetical protein